VLKERARPKPEKGKLFFKRKQQAFAAANLGEFEGYLNHGSVRIPPLVLGHEFCGTVGTVVEVGDGVTGFAPSITLYPKSSCPKSSYP